MRKLGVGTKLAYGVGTMAFAAKDAAFVNFVTFYYTQVVGLSGTLTGLAALVALASDAISDPIVGAISDNHRSPYGRRHPFMLAAAVPLAVSFYFLFSPPSGMGDWGNFAWLAVVAVSLRTFLTVFAIPHAALGAELSHDYEERSVIVSYRTAMGWLAGILLPAFALTVLFRSHDGVDGRLAADNYVTYAIFSGALALAAILWSCFFTRKEIPHLPPGPRERIPLTLRRPFADMYRALANRNFRWMFIALLCIGASTGVAITLGFYMNTYFWEFSTKQMAAFAIPSLLATVVAFSLVRPLGQRMEKKRILLVSFVILIANGTWFVGLRLIDVLPANGSTSILLLALVHNLILVVNVMMLQIIAPSMVADIVDEYEVETGERKEGVFFAAVGFATKAVTGLGTLIGGIVIDSVQLPTGAEPGTVAPEILWNLGFVAGPLIAASFLIPMLLMRNIHLSRERHGELQAVLEQRRADSLA